MNRFFKAISSDNTLDIIMADNHKRAEVSMMFRPWHNVFMSFEIVECGRQDWVDWWKNKK